MSATDFWPTLNISSWQMSRTAQWGTGVQTAVTGDRTRTPHQTTPNWKWTLKRGILGTANLDLAAIQDLYFKMYGRLDYFLWQDPEPSIIDPTQQVNLLNQYYWPVSFTHDSTDFDRFAFELWECGTVEFDQVKLPTDIFNQIQRPHGAVISASLSITTAHIQGGGYSGEAWIGLGATATNFGGEPVSWILRDSSAWSKRTDTISISIDTPITLMLTMSIAGSLLGTASPADEFDIYDVSVTVHYEDGTTETRRPSTAAINPDPQGTVTNPSNAIDNDTTTFASIKRTLFGPGTQSTPELVLSNFI